MVGINLPITIDTTTSLHAAAIISTSPGTTTFAPNSNFEFQVGTAGAVVMKLGGAVALSDYNLVNTPTRTPYNTYTMTGLPPTPIAMVGREAIHAALNPSDGTSLYFVARGDGSHVFSDDLDDHNSAVREFQLKRRADYRSSPAPQSAPADAAEPAEQDPASETAPADAPTPDEQH